MSLKVSIEKNLSPFKLNVNFEHRKGILGILGASGSGKSLTLKAISGLITPDKGSITLNDKILYDSNKRVYLKPQERNIGYLFQNYALFPNMNVYENISAGLFNLPKDERKRITEYYLEKLSLKDIENHYPSQLSGGQMQRTALARAMAKEPNILLLDEPFSALDLHLKLNLEKDLIPVLKEYKGLIIMVSHDIEEIYRICDEIIVYDKGSSLAKRKKEDLFKSPSNLTEARLTGCQNIFRCKKINEHSVYIKGLDLKLNLKRKIGNDVNFIGIRSHDIYLNKTESNSFPFTICNIIENPFHNKVYVNNSNGSLEIEMAKNNFNHNINDKITLSFNEENLFLFSN